MTYAEIAAQNIHLDMPPVKVENLVDDGDRIRVGKLELEVWHTPGHTDGQLSFRLGNLLFSGDNLFRDGCVGAIDAHHGSSIPDFIKSLQRIRASDVEWLLPSHGPVFRKDDRLIDRTIARLETYLHMADFGTCAIDWPLMDQWERELVDGKMPRVAMESGLVATGGSHPQAKLPSRKTSPDPVSAALTGKVSHAITPCSVRSCGLCRIFSQSGL